MTRKDFELIASIIRSHYAHRPAQVREGQELAVAFSLRLAEINPGFRESLFLKACDPGYWDN